MGKITKTTKKRRWVRISLLILNYIAAAALLCSYAAAYISPLKFWPLAFFGIAYPVILIINLLFVLVWLILWNKFIYLSLLTMLVGIGNLRTIVPVRFGSQKAHSQYSLRVATYNVHSLYGNQADNVLPETRSQVTDFLASENPDLVCVQEFYAIGEEYMKTLHKFSRSIRLGYFFFKNYRDFWQKTKINAIATFSRYPIVDQGFFRLGDKSTFGIFTDIAIKGDTIRVYNLHLESIRLGNDDYSFYSNLTDPAADEKNFSKGSRKMIWKLKKAFTLRAIQVEMLTAHMKYSPYPVLICGDFNDTPSSFAYHTLSKGRNDAFVKSGNEWIGSTYAGRFPAFRIDYMLYDDFFTAISYQKKEVNMSDHYPVISEFSFNH
ncbi:MAG: endonuclease/exonuclease/phosphatase family protein [Bacteroidetes bacterium]|nr:endonuclease/exonuclease/phosphatase family protein [Bacteroidota bacterium]